MNGPSPAATGLLGWGSLRTDTDQRATFVELFFVFAVTQIAAQVYDDPSIAGVGKGLLAF